MPKAKKLAGSFRDPDGFLFTEDGKIFRQVNLSYKSNYDLLMSGLYDNLVQADLLISHREVKGKPKSADTYKTIQPNKLDFISYPYEWSFSQYKDAALTTLEIQRRAMQQGMTLKDASAYNIQFQNGQPIFIDTLSFEKYEDGNPWIAYRQFCQHFLAPLALMAKTDVDLSKMLRVYIDGIPLPLASKLLPRSTWLSSLAAHIHYHAKSQQKYADKGGAAKSVKVSKSSQLALIASLASTINKLEWKPEGTEWGEYYTFTNYSQTAFAQKQKIVEKYIKHTKPKTVWDIGANDGSFSRLASNQGINTVAFDIDPVAVEKNYRQVRKKSEEDILPLIMDLTNPSPSIGWANEERQSIIQRGPADLILALALIHHLAISNNVPLTKIADFLSKIGTHIILEFVPKEDSQTQKLLASREDIFGDYDAKSFEKAMETRFKIIEKQSIRGSKRTLYLLRKK